MFSLVSRVIAQLGTVASVVALIVSSNPRTISETQQLLAGVAIVLFVFLIVAEFVHWRQSGPRKYKVDDPAIATYMYKWISKGGRVAILSRDLSWGRAEPIRSLLLKKAGDNELTVCLQEMNDLGKELQAAGAKVITFPALNYIPVSRFTIVMQGRDGARVAIGRPFKDVHLIEEFSSGKHPAFAVANDLIEILARASDLGNHERAAV